MNLKSFHCLLLVVLLIQGAGMARAQAPVSSELYNKMAALDSIFFEAYNKCDTVTMESLLTEGLEFYHDKGGLTIGSAKLITGLKNNVCSQVRRALKKGSLLVYPMDNLGALVQGEHYFYDLVHGNKGDFSKAVGVARFFHLWVNKNGIWQMTRVFSYDHKPVD
jgi:Domain of unknown function (DUF4440)